MRASRSLRLALLAGCAAVAIWALPCGSADAAESVWAVTDLNLGAQETLFGMSCDAASACVGVGQEGVVVNSSAPTGGAGAWAISHVALGEKLRGTCAASPAPRSRSASPSTTAAASTPRPNRRPAAAPGSRPGSRKRNRSTASPAPRPASAFWSASKGRSSPRATRPAAPAAWTITHLAEPLALHSVFCTAGPFCVAGDTAGNLVTTTEPAGGAGSLDPDGPARRGKPAARGLLCRHIALRRRKLGQRPRLDRPCRRRGSLAGDAAAGQIPDSRRLVPDHDAVRAEQQQRRSDGERPTRPAARRRGRPST